MPPSDRYQYLIPENRAAIMIASDLHHSVRAIAHTPGRPASREIQKKATTV